MSQRDWRAMVKHGRCDDWEHSDVAIPGGIDM